MKLNCLRYAAIAAALLVALISCSGRVAVAPEQVNSPPVQMEFSASRDAASGFDPDGKEDGTRVSLGGDGSLIWSTSDAITLFPATGGHALFNCSGLSNDGRSAIFSGVAPLSDYYYALSPAQESALCNHAEGTIEVFLRPDQDAVAGGFDPSAALAVARSEGDRLAFRNVVALLGFAIRNDGVTSVRLSARSGGSDGPLFSPAGSATVSWNGGNPSADIEEGSSEVLLTGDFVKGNRYYMAVFPGTYTSLELEFTDASGRTARYYNPVPLDLERNSIVNLFDLEIPAAKWEYPSIMHADNILVPAGGAISELTEVTVLNGSGWDLRVEYSGCVTSAYWSAAEGGVCYTVTSNSASQQRTGSITIILSKEGAPEVTAVIGVSQEAAPVLPPAEESWVRVASAADLLPGREYVIACPSYSVVATDISSQVMGSADASFKPDHSAIITLPVSAMILTLGGSAGSWTFTGKSGGKLGCTAVKKLAWGSGTTTWNISFSGGTTSLASTNSGFGALQYNSSSPRFTTYTSGQQAVVLYYRTGGGQGTRIVASSASAVTPSGATLSSSYSCADAPPSAAGFRYGTSSANLSEDAAATVPSAQNGTFSATLGGLLSGTTYYYSAYIVENGVTFHGSLQSFTTNDQGGPSSGGADYGWPELPVQTDRNRDGIDDLNPDYYYSHTFRADASTIRNFSSCYSRDKYHPVWVAAPMHSSYLGSSGRNDSYRSDPNIKCPQADHFSGYTRGHMVGSSDRTVSKPTNRQAFYYSNIGAQSSTGFNTGGGAWNNLEEKVDTYLCADTLYQVIGCIFDSFTDRSGRTVAPRTTTEGSQVPTAWYKVLLRTKGGNIGKDVRECNSSELQCVAFILGHYGNQGHKPCRNDMYTVAELERLTGLTFFVNVPNAPKERYDAAEWGIYQ